MQFETPNANLDKLKKNVKKAVAVGAVATAVFSGEGCKPNDKSSSNQEFAKEALRVLENLNQEHNKQQEKSLFSYFNNIGHPMLNVLSSKEGNEETSARAWDLIKKKGFFKNGTDGKIHMECKRVGLVPVEIKVNGQFVPVGPDDYTKEELSFIRSTDKPVEDLDSSSLESPNTDGKKTESNQNKPFISNAENF